MKKIILIHAVIAAMEPIKKAFAQYWPEAKILNILDETLSDERAKSNNLTEALFKRILELVEYAVAMRADGILFTCSAFGEAIDAAAEKVSIPVLKPNEAMFRLALEKGKNIGMVASFQPAVAGMEKEFYEIAQQTNPLATIRTICVPAAKEALNRGDIETHNRLMAKAASEFSTEDIILLAHFSSSTAFELASSESGKMILTSPKSAVELLKDRVTNPHNA